MSTMGTGTGSMFGTQEAGNSYGSALHDPNAPAVGVVPANEHGTGKSESDRVADMVAKIEEARRAVGAIDPNALKDMPGSAGTAADLQNALAKAEAIKGQVEAKNNEKNAREIVGMAMGAGLIGAVLGSGKDKDTAGKDPSGKDTAVLALAENGNEKGKDHKSPEEFKTVEQRFAALLDDFKKNNLKELGVSDVKDVPEHNTANLKYDNSLPNLKIAENKGKQETMVRT